MVNKKYKCRNCGKEWKSPAKNFSKCSNCNTSNLPENENIALVKKQQEKALETDKGTDNNTSVSTAYASNQTAVKILKNKQSTNLCGNCYNQGKKVIVPEDFANCPVCGEIIIWED